MSRPVEHWQAPDFYDPSDWEANAHNPCPPYDWKGERVFAWYDTRWGNVLAWILILGGIAIFWAVVSWRLDGWAS